MKFGHSKKKIEVGVVAMDTCIYFFIFYYFFISLILQRTLSDPVQLKTLPNLRGWNTSLPVPRVKELSMENEQAIQHHLALLTERDGGPTLT